jgi:hypothetical protein
MIEHMKNHERYVREMLEKNLDREALFNLLQYHDKQIQWLQHERFVHLLTMLFVCLFMLITFGYTLLMPSLPCIILTALLMILSVAYIIHYYRLENGVQKWYSLSNQIRSNSLL